MTSGSSAPSRWPRTPERTHRWEQGSSSATLQILGRHVVGVELVGAFTRDAIPIIQPPLEELLEGSGRVRLFWDAEALTSNDAEVRDALVQMLRKRRSQWDSLHVLFASALIGMTVSAIGLVFMGAIKSYRDRGKFHAAVEGALRATDDG